MNKPKESKKTKAAIAWYRANASMNIAEEEWHEALTNILQYGCEERDASAIALRILVENMEDTL